MWIYACKAMFYKGAATPGLNKVSGIMIKAIGDLFVPPVAEMIGVQKDLLLCARAIEQAREIAELAVLVLQARQRGGNQPVALPEIVPLHQLRAFAPGQCLVADGQCRLEYEDVIDLGGGQHKGADPDVLEQPPGDHGKGDRPRFDQRVFRYGGLAGDLVDRLDQRQEEFVGIGAEPQHIVAQRTPVDVVVSGHGNHHIRLQFRQQVLDDDAFLGRGPDQVRHRKEFVVQAGRRGKLPGEDGIQIAGDGRVVTRRAVAVGGGASGQEDPVGARGLGHRDLPRGPELHGIDMRIGLLPRREGAPHEGSGDVGGRP